MAAELELALNDCFVAGTYHPARQCRPSRALCGRNSGVNSFPSLEACCAPGSGAFGAEGCSPRAPVTPCWAIASHYPRRRCRLETDVAVCNRGWGVFDAEEVCCAASFSGEGGCSTTAAAAPVAAAALVASGYAAFCR